MDTGIARNSYTDKVDLWLGLAVFTFAVVLFIGYAWPEPYDFGLFYTAKQIYLHHTPAHLYDLDLQRQIEQQTYNIPADKLTQRFLPYNHLPYETFLWVPLDRLSAKHAFWAWRLVSLALLVATLLFFRRMLATERTLGQLLLIAFAFFPVPYCLLAGQDTFVTLAVLVFGFGLLNAKRDFPAGAVLALGLFKFQLVLPIIGIFFLRRAWKIVAGFTVSALALLAISVIMVGSRGMLGLVHLWAIGEKGAIVCINPRTMPNVRGLLGMLPGGHGSLVFVGTLAVSVVLLRLVVYQVRSVSSFAEMLALAICFVLPVSFHTNLYDLALLIVPILVLLDNWPGLRDFRWTRRVLLFLLFNPLLYVVLLATYQLPFLTLLVGLLWFCLRVALRSTGVKSREQLAVGGDVSLQLANGASRPAVSV